MAWTERYVDRWEAEGRPYKGQYYADPDPVGVYRGDYEFMVHDEDGHWHLP